MTSSALKKIWQNLDSVDYPNKVNGKYYAIASINGQNKRNAWVEICPNTNLFCVITPEGYSIETHAHEYGGQCFSIYADRLYFFDCHRQGIFSHSIDYSDDKVRQITDNLIEGQSILQMADFDISEDGKFLVSVAEIDTHTQYAKSVIVLLNLETGSKHILLQGHDFFASPRIIKTANGYKLAWLGWDWPHMPWDNNQCYIQTLTFQGDLVDTARCLNPMSFSSISQIDWVTEDRLVFAMDSDADNYDFSNLYCYENNKITAITQTDCEFGEAHWQFGQRRWHKINNSQIVAIATCQNNDNLNFIDIDKKTTTAIVECTFAHIRQLQITNNEAVFSAQFADRSPAMMSLSLESPPALKPIYNGVTKKAIIPRHITYQTQDKHDAHAFLYLPEKQKSKPPLICMIHGGPTGRTNSAYHPIKQLFIAQGFAVLDINHRGSTGYGRQFRQSLNGHWGKLEVRDTIDAIHYCIEHEYVDKKRIFIRGSSAGGYSVLCALTDYADTFTAAGVYYGIGDLATLAEITHKFEASYTDILINESYHPDTAKKLDSQFYQRSPINRLDKIMAPIIWFQGGQDNVVPESLSKQFIQQLKQNNIHFEYHLYAEEAHGFRSKQNKIDALQKEIAFYRQF